MPQEMLTQLPQRAATGGYTSQVFSIQADSYFIIQLSRMTARSSSAFRFRVDIYTTADGINYQTLTWSYSSYPPDTIQPYWLKLTLDFVTVSMQCFTVRVSKLFDYDSNSKPTFQIHILEAYKVFSSIGTETVIFNQSNQLVNIHVYYKCPSSNKKVHSEINKCNNCSGSNKIYNLNHYCHGSINNINIYAKFNSQDVKQELSQLEPIIEQLLNKFQEIRW